MKARAKRAARKKPFDLAPIGDVARLENRWRRAPASEIASDDLLVVTQEPVNQSGANEAVGASDQYAPQMDCWTSAMKDGVLPSDVKTTTATQTTGQTKETGTWLSVAWQEVQGEWEKLQLATKDSWDGSRQSFEKAWSEFTKARSDAGQH